jgi:hypothetical protein
VQLPNDQPQADPDYYWWWKSRLPERRGQLCFVTARGKMNTIRVEFLDGFIVFTSRYAARRVK